MDNLILILTGPPGAGKSTIADLLARGTARPAVHLYADDFFDRYIKSGYILPWLKESQKQNETVNNAIHAAACAYAEGGYFVVIDGIIGPWFLEPYRAAAHEKSLALHYVVLRPASSDITWARVLQRQTHGLKAEGPVRELYRQFSALGELERHVVDSGAGDPSQVAERIQRGIETKQFRLSSIGTGKVV